MDAESLEGVRCLSNMGMDQTAPFCLLLLGQPTLRHRLRRGAFTALDQRIAVRYAIAGLDAKETPAMCSITSRSPAAPTPCSPMTRSALIHEVSRGLPRLINNLAVASLIAAFAAKKAIVDESAARAAVAEISAE